MAQVTIDERLAKQLQGLVLKRIGDDALVLPTMPTVAIKCLEILRQQDFSFKEAAGVLEHDPTLAARVLKLATSAAFGNASGNVSLQQAFTRIGVKGLKTVLIEASAQKVFMSRNPQIAAAAKVLWEHSVAVATMARDICALTGGKDSDAAYLAGLMHDVGKPVVASILLEAERQIAELRNEQWIGSGEWTAVVKRTHRTVGVALVQKWQLPTLVVNCVKDCNEFDPSDRSAVVNAVCMGNALAKQAGVCEEGTDVDDAKALVMIGRSMLGLDDAVLNNLMASLKGRVSGIYD
jgi:putative nucleotidyltransferase with HDIG domain